MAKKVFSFIRFQVFFIFAMEMLQLVQQLTHDPKFKGLNPAPAAAIAGEIKFLDF
jgi:hypothetical protein